MAQPNPNNDPRAVLVELDADTHRAAAINAAARKTSLTTYATERLRAAIIDDIPETRDIVARTFEEAGSIGQIPLFD